MRKVWGRRSLLNLPGHHSTAAIIAEIENTVDWPEGKSRNGNELTSYTAEPNITLIVTDCSEKVNIEIDIGTPARLENSIHKLDTMIDALKSMRKGVIREHDRLVERKKHIPKPKDFGSGLFENS